jgi:hypothetical protein
MFHRRDETTRVVVVTVIESVEAVEVVEERRGRIMALL